MLLDAAADGTMMAIDTEKATKIIEVMTSTDYQAQNDNKNEPKKGTMDPNILNTLVAQNKILAQ